MLGGLDVSIGGQVADQYEGIPKHKEPWVSAHRGTLCPKDADGVALFAEAITDPKKPGKRYATDGSRAYCAHDSNIVTESGGTFWHGFPCDWSQVPVVIQRKWVSDGKIPRLKIR
jgi:hypothetical protein